MTKERIEKELTKVRAQLETLQAKQKDLEEQKRMALPVRGIGACVTDRIAAVYHCPVATVNPHMAHCPG